MTCNFIFGKIKGEKVSFWLKGAVLGKKTQIELKRAKTEGKTNPQLLQCLCRLFDPFEIFSGSCPNERQSISLQTLLCATKVPVRRTFWFVFKFKKKSKPIQAFWAV